MEDLDDVRRSTGVIADFSNWGGVKGEGAFKKMVIKSKETVSGEETEKVENEKTRVINKPIENNLPKEETMNRPGVEAIQINQNEVKNIALKMIPTIDKLEEKDYNQTIVNSINFAIRFEQIWNDFIRRN